MSVVAILRVDNLTKGLSYKTHVANYFPSVSCHGILVLARLLAREYPRVPQLLAVRY